MLRINRQMGFAHLGIGTIFGLYIVWGWRGNLYPERTSLKIGNLSGIGLGGIEWCSKGLKTTIYTVWVKRQFRRYRFLPLVINWNSEHIAARWGHFEDAGHVMKVYDGVLGQHVIH